MKSVISGFNSLKINKKKTVDGRVKELMVNG